MNGYILTGAPGSGKTSVIKLLEETGENVVNESATDIIYENQSNGINEPWKFQKFIDEILKLQINRQKNSCINKYDLCFYDRSPICTYALSIYLGFEPSILLMNEIDRINSNNIYEKNVFFIDNLGFIENTNARKISFEESVKFEKIHLDSYNKFGFKCIHIPKMTVEERANKILNII
jgi:predicted ATPase